MRVLVLGAGFGGLELTTTLSEELGDDVDVTLIDQGDGFVFGFSKLDVMFGRPLPDTVRPPVPRPREAGRALRADDDPLDRPGREAGRDRRRHASTPTCWSSRSAPTSHPEATPGLVEAGHEFYTVAGAFAAGERARATSTAAG